MRDKKWLEPRVPAPAASTWSSGGPGSSWGSRAKSSAHFDGLPSTCQQQVRHVGVEGQLPSLCYREVLDYTWYPLRERLAPEGFRRVCYSGDRVFPRPRKSAAVGCPVLDFVQREFRIKFDPVTKHVPAPQQIPRTRNSFQSFSEEVCPHSRNGSCVRPGAGEPLWLLAAAPLILRGVDLRLCRR